MNINSIGSSLRFDPYRGRNSERSASTSFGTQLMETRNTAVSANRIVMRLQSENCVTSSGNLLEDHYYVEYAEESTADDPVVRITGKSDSGEEFDYTKHVFDIDPRSANYVELEALYTHQIKTGGFEKSQLTRNHENALPIGGLENLDFWETQNFIDKVTELTMSTRFDANSILRAKELLKLYQGYIDEHFAS